MHVPYVDAFLTMSRCICTRPEGYNRASDVDRLLWCVCVSDMISCPIQGRPMYLKRGFCTVGYGRHDGIEWSAMIRNPTRL